MAQQQFEDVLRINGIDTTLYGVGKAIRQLMKEINEGECSLGMSESGSATKIFHKISIYWVILQSKDGKVLVESNPYFHPTMNREGWSRQRFSPLFPRKLSQELILILSN